MAEIISCDNVTKRYKEVCALSYVNLSIPDEGGIIGFLGRTEAGKRRLSCCGSTRSMCSKRN